MQWPDYKRLLDEILLALENDEDIETKEQFHILKNSILAKYKVPLWAGSTELIERYRTLIAWGQIRESPRIWKILRKRAIRSLSGVAVISLLTKFWGCPWKCIFCPTYEWLPKSYITGEPAVQRAENNAFDPLKQIWNRLHSLETTGHPIAKCDVRIIGGTWSVYPRAYQEDFIRAIYDAHTNFPNGDCISPSLEEAKARNETALSRVIGIAIETRPDWIDEAEITRLRYYGITRVEIGYQTTCDSVNILNKRWHGNIESIYATRLLKDAGFKVVAHIMPNLLGSTPSLDRESLETVFKNADFRPDEIKIYPMVVTPHSELEVFWREWRFTPYDDMTLIDLMVDLISMLPEYVRLNRMYRDIPKEEILAGSTIANLRQVTEIRMRSLWKKARDISAREIRSKWNNPKNAVLDEYMYEASWGHEYFLQYIDPLDRTVFALLRLRIPSGYYTGERHFLSVLDHAAIIREVHTFGDQLHIGERGNGSGQHMGFGKRLIARAEAIVREKYTHEKNTLTHIAVIAGVWVRAYYEKLGYVLRDEYMVKEVSRCI